VLKFIIGWYFVTAGLGLAQHTKHKEEPRVPVVISPEQQGRIGVTLVRVSQQPMMHQVRTVGTVVADERTESHVHSKLNGWIEKIHADYVGKEIKKGQVLFELYSPELITTQEEYLAARGQGTVGKELAQVALERLKLWGVPEREILALQKGKRASKTIAFESPISGIILNKNAIQGMYITPGMELYHIADLSKIWVIATLYEYDIAAMETGNEAVVELPFNPTKKITSQISYIYPDIDTATRTGRARLELENKQLTLRPGMYVNVILKKDLGTPLAIPEDAVIDTGTRRIVFVRTHNEQFHPREVKLGPRVAGKFAVLSGLKAGEEVVTRAHFLIDAESKLKATQQGGAAHGSGHGGH
jgi:membrane fusion protein, copper/silver efflux system